MTATGQSPRAIAAEVPAGSRLLDVGVRSRARSSDRLATLAPEIETTGLDVDAAMIERAERKADRAARSALGAARRSSSRTSPRCRSRTRSFDVVVSSFAVHHWPDRPAGLAEIMRVLRPGGRAIVWDIAPPHPTAAPTRTHTSNRPAPRSTRAHAHGNQAPHTGATDDRPPTADPSLINDAPDADALPPDARRSATTSRSPPPDTEPLAPRAIIRAWSNTGTGSVRGRRPGRRQRRRWRRSRRRTPTGASAIGHAANDAWNTLAALPAWQLALIVVLVIGGLIVLRRAL